MPDSIQNIPIKVWVLGLIWAVGMSMAPLGGFLVYWLANWNTYEMDWKAAGAIAGPAAGAATIGYWRKYKAQIALPPDWAQARDLAMAVKTVTTVETVEHQKSPAATVTTTVQETVMRAVPPEPPKEP